MTPKYFAIKYDDPGVFIKLRDESEILLNAWDKLIDSGDADVFRLEMVNNLPQLRRAIVEEVNVNEEAECEEEEDLELQITGWELVI